MSKVKLTRVTRDGGNNVFEEFTIAETKWTSHLNDDETTKDGMEPSHLITAFKPLFVCMTLMGVFDYWSIVESDRRRERFGKRLLKGYRITIIIFCVSNFLRYFPAYTRSSGFGSELLTNIMMHAFFFHIAIGSIVCYKIAENPRKLRHFYSLWDEHWKRAIDASGNNTDEKEMTSICGSLRKACIISLIVGWVVIAGMVLFSMYTVYYTHTFQDVITPLSSSHPQASVAKAIYLVLLFYLSGVWIFNAILMFLVHLALYYGVKQCTKKIDELTLKTLKEAQENMEQSRKEHNEWCEMIAVADDIFQFIAGISLLTYIFCILIIVYNMCWHEIVRNSPFQLMSHFFWLSVFTIMLSILMTACCLVNNWAHAPANSLYNLTLQGFAGDFAFQVIAFLHRLNGSPIGLSALCLFVIDKTVVISVGGMLATYFVVLIQFQQSSVSTTAGVDGTTAV